MFMSFCRFVSNGLTILLRLDKNAAYDRSLPYQLGDRQSGSLLILTLSNGLLKSDGEFLTFTYSLCTSRLRKRDYKKLDGRKEKGCCTLISWKKKDKKKLIGLKCIQGH